MDKNRTNDDDKIVIHRTQIMEDEISTMFRKDPLPTRYYYKDADGQYKCTTSFIR